MLFLWVQAFILYILFLSPAKDQALPHLTPPLLLGHYVRSILDGNVYSPTEETHIQDYYP